MVTLDHVGFAVADYERSKASYERALAPLALGFQPLSERCKGAHVAARRLGDSTPPLTGIPNRSTCG